jgi:hypothetical protein
MPPARCRYIDLAPFYKQKSMKAETRFDHILLSIIQAFVHTSD